MSVWQVQIWQPLIWVAPEGDRFHRKMAKIHVLKELPNVIQTVDILVVGYDNESADNAAISESLWRYVIKESQAKYTKMPFQVHQHTFFAETVWRNSVKPDLPKLQTLTRTSAPKNEKDL